MDMRTIRVPRVLCRVSRHRILRLAPPPPQVNDGAALLLYSIVVARNRLFLRGIRRRPAGAHHTFHFLRWDKESIFAAAGLSPTIFSFRGSQFTTLPVSAAARAR